MIIHYYKHTHVYIDTIVTNCLISCTRYALPQPTRASCYAVGLAICISMALQIIYATLWEMNNRNCDDFFVIIIYYCWIHILIIINMINCITLLGYLINLEIKGIKKS